MRPTENVLSGSVSSMRVFQKRILSGKPSRSRGPGSSSRKKSASWASNDRSPLGTILIGWMSEVGRLKGVPEEPDATGGNEGCAAGLGEVATGRDSWLIDGS